MAFGECVMDKMFQVFAQYKRSLRMSKFNHAAISSEFFMLVSLSQTKGKGKHKKSYKETNGNYVFWGMCNE